MTDIRAELLRAALASPDDAERLVYADWLEEHGEVARAQIIQLQCEIARLDAWDRRRVELQWEADAVLWELGDRWRDELPVFDGVEWTALERGFASAVRVRNPATLYRHGQAIAAAAPVYRVELESVTASPDAATAPLPWLRVLRVHSPTESGEEDALLSIPAELELVADETYDDFDWLVRAADAPLARLSMIRNQAASAEFLERLVAAPWAADLAALDFPSHWIDHDTGYNSDPRLGPDGAHALLRLGKLTSLALDRQRIGSRRLGGLFVKLHALRELSVRESECTDIGAFEQASGAPLRRLDLSGNAIGCAGAQAIARASRLREVQRLELDTCEISSLGLSELTHAPLWHELRWLDLSRNPLGAAGVRALAEASPPARLHTLVLADADLDEAAGLALSKVAWLGSLAVLDLSGNRLGRCAESLRGIAAGALRKLGLASCGLERTEAVAIARFWPSLVHLDLGGNPLTDAGLERFVTRAAPMLQSLRMRECNLSDDGIELLASGRAPRLRILDLSGNTVREAPLAALLQSSLVQSLETLDLSNCTLGHAVGALSSVPLPPRLRRLDLRGNVFTEEMALALANSETLHAVPTIVHDIELAQYSRQARKHLRNRLRRNWIRSESERDDSDD